MQSMCKTLIILSVIFTSCSKNNNGESKTLSESDIILEYQALKNKNNKNKEDYLRISDISHNYHKAKAKNHFFKKMVKKWNKMKEGDYQILPTEILEDETQDLFVVNKEGETKKNVYSWFSSPDEKVSIMQDGSGKGAKISVSEAGEYTINGFVIKGKGHLKHHLRYDIFNKFLSFTQKDIDNKEAFDLFFDNLRNEFGEESTEHNIYKKHKKDTYGHDHKKYKKHKHDDYQKEFEHFIKHVRFVTTKVNVKYVEPEICPNLEGDGTANNPFLVKKDEDLVCLFTLNIVRQPGNNVKLETDIDLRNENRDRGFINLSYWAANLDGNGHTIHWGVEDADDFCGADNCYSLGVFRGFFGGATVKNLTFEIYNVVAEKWLNVGGVSGSTWGANFENITVNHNGIFTTGGQRGGFVGTSTGLNTYKDIVVNNFKVESCVNEPFGDLWTGANGGFTTYTSELNTFENITINNPHFSGCANGNANGFMTDNFNEIIMNNITVNNLTIENEVDYLASGFMRFITADAQLLNISVNNSNINARNSNISAFMNSSFFTNNDDGTIKSANITAENILIDGANLTNNRDRGDFGVTSGFSYGVDGNMDFKNIIIKDLNIKASGSNIVGFILNTNQDLKLDGLRVENFNAENTGGLGTETLSILFGNLGNFGNTGSASIENVVLDGFNLKDYDSENYTAVTGLAQMISIPTVLNNIEIKNGETNSTFANSALVAVDIVHDRDSTNVYNLNIDNVTMNAINSNATLGIGFPNITEGFSIEGMNVSNVNVNINDGNYGGVLYYNASVSALNDINFTNHNVIGGDNVEIGGVIYGDGNQLSLTDVSIDNMNITSGNGGQSVSVGGVINGAGPNLLMSDVNISNMNIESFRYDAGWEALSLVIAASNGGTPSNTIIRKIKVTDSNLISHSNNMDYHRMMGGVIAHIYGGGFLMEDVTVFNSNIISDYYSLSGGILGEMTLGNGDNIVLERIESFNNRIKSLNYFDYPVGDWRRETYGGIFGLITPLFDENGLEQRGFATMKDIFVKSKYIGINEAWGIGGTWARNMIYLENSLVIGGAGTNFHGCAISGGETFNGINNYGVYCAPDDNVVNIPRDTAIETNPDSYPGFDFTNVWFMGISYPQLRSGLEL